MKRMPIIGALVLALVFAVYGAVVPADSDAAAIGVEGDPSIFRSLKREGFSILGSFEAWSNRRDASAQLKRARRVGAIPLITWEPWQPPPLGTKDQGAPQRRFSNKSIVAGRHDRYIRAYAKSLAKFGRPVYLRLAHEFPGSWYPWSRDPSNYRAAWRRIHLIMRRSGASNVRFVWSPQIARTTMVADAKPYWPGKNYVDFVSTSFVYFGLERAGPHQSMIDALAQLKTYGLPVMIAEANTEYSNRHEVMAALASFVAANRWIKMVVWSQSISRGQRNWSNNRMEWPLLGDRKAIELLRSMR